MKPDRARALWVRRRGCSAPSSSPKASWTTLVLDEYKITLRTSEKTWKQPLKRDRFSRSSDLFGHSHQKFAYLPTGCLLLKTDGMDAGTTETPKRRFDASRVKAIADGLVATERRIIDRRRRWREEDARRAADAKRDGPGRTHRAVRAPDSLAYGQAPSGPS